MIHQTFPETATRAASHCAELVKPAAAPADALPVFAGAVERVARHLSEVLTRNWGDARVVLRVERTERRPGSEAIALGGHLAAVSLYGTAADEGMILIAIDGPGLLRRLDRTFGGSGVADAALPASLPHSVDLMAHRFEKLIRDSLAQEFGAGTLVAGPRGNGTAAPAPFTPEAKLLIAELAVVDGSGDSLPLALALDEAALPALMPSAGASASGRAAAHSPHHSPFADIPMIASARLVDMTIPLGRIATIVPGTVLPITVSRNVPLLIDARAVATGTIGNVDEQVALQITRTHFQEETQ